MSNDKLLVRVGILFMFFVLVSKTAFTVNEWERGLKFRFGAFSGEEIQPGLSFMVPIMNTIEKYDVRIQTMDKSAERFITVNKEELLVDSFVKWRISDLQKYYKTGKMLYCNIS